MNHLKRLQSLNVLVYLSIFFVTLVTGLLLSLSVSFILQDFIRGLVKVAIINSLLLGAALAGSCVIFNKMLFKIKIVYVIFISFSLILGTGIISLLLILYYEPTLFMYYYQGAVSYLFINFLFVLALYIISSGLIAYRENMVKAEKRNRLQHEKLIQADKMASVGILVSGVAHEINNPNNFMRLNSSNLEEVWNELQPILDEHSEEKGEFIVAGFPYSELKNEVGELISGITDGSDRIKTIVNSLKDFARQDPGRMNETVDINSVIASSLVILANMLKKSSDHVRIEYSDDTPCITGNRQQIEQVIINLLSNSCQALHDRSKAIVVTTAFDETRSNVILTVRDEGAGISAENLKHIMDPFYTTKRDSGGTGLGLSISYNIINEHKGEINVHSEVGVGTEFTIVLPTRRDDTDA